MVEPTDLGLDLKDERLQSQCGGEIAGRLMCLLKSQPLEVVHRDRALGLHNASYVAASGHGDRQLDRQVVARSLGAGNRCCPPTVDGGSSCFCERIELATLLVGGLGLHKAVTFEALQRRVDLPAVHRPVVTCVFSERGV